MSRKPSAATGGGETAAERVAYVLRHSAGTLPMCLVLYSAADADEAHRLLAAKGKAGKLITVKQETKP